MMAKQPTVKMISLKPHTYAGKTIEADQEFDVDEQYAGTLVSLGRARLAEEKSTKAKPTTTKAETEEDKKGDDKKSGSSAYQTRRMTAKK